MRRERLPVVIVAALVGTLPVLLLLDAEPRRWAFRAYVVAVAVVAVRAIVRHTDGTATASIDDDERDPFRRPRPVIDTVARALARGRAARAMPPLSGGAALVHTAMSTAGGAHHRLRPVLLEILDERTQEGGRTDALGPTARELLRADRPPPRDRLAPGLTAAEIDAVLTDLEAL